MNEPCHGCASLEKQLSDAMAEVGVLEDKIQELESELNNVVEERNELQEDVDGYKSDALQAQDERDAAEQKVDIQAQGILDLEREIADLRTSLARYQEGGQRWLSVKQ